MRGLWGTTALGAVLGLMAATPAEAQEAVARENETITVTATRSATDTFDVPSTVSVITSEEIEENLVTDIKDLIRFEPGVSVATSPARFSAALSAVGRDGNSSFTIRGLGGNRVLFQVDGVRVPDGFSFGPNAFGRGDYVDMDLLQSVEIVRGPGSALYGSDGLAGVVSFITRDPEDFLSDDQTFGGRARASYASADDSWAESLTGAVQLGDHWSALLAYTRRDGHETDNQGENDSSTSLRTEPNPQEIESNAVLGRIVFEPSAQHRLRLTADYGDRNIATEGLSARSGTVLNLDGLDESERSRVAFDYSYDNDGGFIDSAFFAVYTQSSWLRQFSFEDRNPAVDRTRDTTYDNDVWGATLQAESTFGDVSDIEHNLVYGLDYSVTTQGAIRDGTAPTPPTVFPERPFPETDYERLGVFLVDEVSLANGTLMLYPAVRYDSYDLSPQDDALYTGALQDQSDEHVSPKFGIVWQPTESFAVFANIAQGFKAPAPSEVNNYFENLTLAPFNQAYTSAPNPELRPETSDGVEVGIRGRGMGALGANWDWSLAAFNTRYQDFISQQVVDGSGTALDPFIYQYINLSEVRISGAEARAGAYWENGFSLNFAASFADGEQTTLGVTEPLETIDPLKLVAGLSYDDADGRWGGQAIVTYAARKDEEDVASATAFRPDAFTILDLTGYWNLTDNATIRVGIFNVTDESYWWWSDARGLTASSAVLDAYTQPGRNFSASIAYRF